MSNKLKMKELFIEKEKGIKMFNNNSTINVMECRNCYEWQTNTTVFPYIEKNI